MTDRSDFGELQATVRATIRPCREADLPALEWMGLYARDREIIRKTFKAQQRGEALMLLAVAAGFPIAQVWIAFGERTGSPPARLWAVRTFFPLQRAGIGRRMMRAAEEIAAARGFSRAELEVDSINRDILHFYRRLGWAVITHPAPGEEDGRYLLAKDLDVSERRRSSA